MRMIWAILKMTTLTMRRTKNRQIKGDDRQVETGGVN
jgi:hypothetical protein